MNVKAIVDAPPELVFEVAADLPNAAKHIHGIERIEMLTDGPVGVGTRFRETRKMFGKESTEEMELTRFNPPKSYTVEADSCGCRFVSTFHFRPTGSGTEVELTLTSTPTTLIARLTTPIGWLMQGTMKKMLLEDLACVKREAESRAGQPECPIERVPE